MGTVPIRRHLTTLPQHQSHHSCHFHPQRSCPHQRRPHRPCWQHRQHFTPRPLPTQHTSLCQLPWLFCSGRSHHPQPTPRPRRVCSHHPQHLATPQKHPLTHRHAPRLGRRHQIHFRRRRTSHDPTQRTPRSRLSPERQMLGHPP